MNTEKENFFRYFLRKQGGVVIFLAVFLFGIIFTTNFADLINFRNIIQQSAIPIISCLGMTLVLMTGGIDLSVGYVVGLGCYLSGAFAILWGVPIALVPVLTLIVGALFGIFNGMLVQIIKIPSFIVTLGTGYIAFGIAQISSDGTALSSMPENFLVLGRTIFLGMPMSVWISLFVVLIFSVLLHKTKYGRFICAVGLNQRATKMSGIRSDIIIVSAYAICGACAAIAGMLLGIRVNNATPVMGGSTHTFTAITAAILGGASLTGGKGSAYGPVLGILTIVMIENIINLSNISFYVFQAVLSVVILIAIVFENVKNKIMQ